MRTSDATRTPPAVACSLVCGKWLQLTSAQQTLASDQWNYYQSKNQKQAIAELAVELAPEARRDAFKQDIKHYEDDKTKIRKEAERLEGLAREADARSEAIMHVHHRWAQSMTLIQVSIALAATSTLPAGVFA